MNLQLEKEASYKQVKTRKDYIKKIINFT